MSIYGVTGYVADIPWPNKAIVHFELNGDLQAAFLKSDRFYKNGRRIPDNHNLNKYLKVGHQVKFSCHINDNPEPSQCKWFIINCWRHIDGEHKVIMSTGMMNEAGTVTDLMQRHGTLMMVDLSGNEHKVHFLASKVYLFGKRLAASKPLSSQLQVDDKIYFDAIPCFPEENNQNCNWFATCVHKGKKPEIYSYKDSSKTETTEVVEDKVFNQFVELIKVDDKPIRGDTPTTNMDLLIDGMNKNLDLLNFNAASSPTHLHQPESDSAINVVGTISKQTSEVSSVSETEVFKVDSIVKIEPNRLNAQILHDIKLLTNDPKAVFAQSDGIILDVINEEYGVILGEFQRNVFQSILFHRSNAFLFKMSLAHSKLSEIFIEGDRVRFIAVDAPKEFICDWIATQVSIVACEQQEEEEEDNSDDDFTDDFIEYTHF